jgi:hypothetical protein
LQSYPSKSSTEGADLKRDWTKSNLSRSTGLLKFKRWQYYCSFSSSWRVWHSAPHVLVHTIAVFLFVLIALRFCQFVMQLQLFFLIATMRLKAARRMDTHLCRSSDGPGIDVVNVTLRSPEPGSCRHGGVFVFHHNSTFDPLCTPLRSCEGTHFPHLSLSLLLCPTETQLPEVGLGKCRIWW